MSEATALQSQMRSTTSKTSKTVNDPQQEDADLAARSAWRTLLWWEWLAIGVMVGTVAVLVILQLPPGVCYGDSGELQLAATLLGVAHPPGYAGYVSIWYLFTLVPGVDPAYMVTLSCMASGLIALALCTLIQIRLGVSAFLAATTTLVLTMHPRVWTNFIAPEVYMMSLTLLVATVYLVMRYSVVGRRRDLLWAAFLYGLVLSNRPPVLFMLPFLLGVSWLAGMRLGLSKSVRLKTLGLAAICAVAPGIYSVTYLLARDQPTTTFNYIDRYNLEYHDLPEVTNGWQARLTRAHWLITGQQFNDLMGNSWKGVRSKLRWIHSEFIGRIRLPAWPVETVLSYRNMLSPILIGLTVIGFIVTLCRSLVSAGLLLGMCISSLVFVCYYRIYGDAADILPLMFAMTVFCGVALSKAVGKSGISLRRQTGPLILLVAMLIFTAFDSSDRIRRAHTSDASIFLREADLASLPARSLVCSNWGRATALWYAKYILMPDQDFDVVNAWEEHWFDILKDRLDQPIFAAVRPPSWDGYHWEPIRNLWRLRKN